MLTTVKDLHAPLPWLAFGKKEQNRAMNFLAYLHYSNLEYFVEILHWTGSPSLSPEGICDALIYMPKKDLCSTWTTASKIATSLQYKRCIAQRECSAVNLMTSMTFFNEMRKIIRPMHCPVGPQPQSCRCLGESCSCTCFPCSSCYLTQKMTLKTEPGQTHSAKSAQGWMKVLDW